MVLCANLKPLKSSELDDLGKSRAGQRSFSQNMVAAKNRSKAEENTTRRFRRKARSAKPAGGQNSSVMENISIKSSSALSKKVGKRIPKNVSEFQRDWRRGCRTPAKQVTFLRWLGHERITQLFANGFPSGMLGELMDALWHTAKEMETETIASDGSLPEGAMSMPEFICSCMCGFASATGFTMETMFLSKNDKQLVVEILDILSHSECPPEKLQVVRDRYAFD